MINNILNKKNFTKNKIKKFNYNFVNSNPFPYIIIDNFLDNKFANKILNEFNINEHWVNYSFVNNFKKYGLKNRSKMSLDLNNLFKVLGAGKFLNYLKKITKIQNLFLDPTLDGGGLHQIFKGGHLNIHTDFTSHTNKKKWKRVLNILIYLNKNWKERYNGNLEFWSPKGKRKIKEIFPKFNRCVIFLTDHRSYHGHPKKLNCPKNISRKSVAAYYFVKQKTNLKLSPTNYIPRPEDNLKKRLLINLDKNLNRMYSYLKRNNYMDDKKITKILNLIK